MSGTPASSICSALLCRIKSKLLDLLRRTRSTGWYSDGVPIEVIAVILGHSDTKTTRKSYARPSVEMLRQQMSKGNTPELEIREDEVEPLWKNDEELTRLCGIR
jgi:integrase